MQWHNGKIGFIHQPSGSASVIEGLAAAVEERLSGGVTMDDDKVRGAVELLKEASILLEETGHMIVAARLGDIIDGLSEPSITESPSHLVGRNS